MIAKAGVRIDNGRVIAQLAFGQTYPQLVATTLAHWPGFVLHR